MFFIVLKWLILLEIRSFNFWIKEWFAKKSYLEFVFFFFFFLFNSLASFYRTSAADEIDLVLELGGSHGIWAIEIKKSTAPKLERGFHLAVEDIQPNRVFVVYTGEERYPKSADIDVVCLRELAQELEALE